MKRVQTILKPIALLLLVIFSISILPKSYFHDLLADHKDLPSCSQLHHSVVLHKQGFNCHFDDLVVTSAFVPQDPQPQPGLGAYREISLVACCGSPVLKYAQHKENRGPPSA